VSDPVYPRQAPRHDAIANLGNFHFTLTGPMRLEGAGGLLRGTGGDLFVVSIRNGVETIWHQRCGRESAHPKDVAERYCGACHRFLEDPQGPAGA